MLQSKLDYSVLIKKRRKMQNTILVRLYTHCGLKAQHPEKNHRNHQTK